MSNIDISLFVDIADKLGLSNGAFVEKDYWAIQLLNMVMEHKFADWNLCFAGGTCLTKAHCQIYRMSEDIDIKIFPKSHIAIRSNNQKIKARKNFKLIILDLINNNDNFNLINSESRDSGCYRTFEISYPKNYEHKSLRPDLKLEFTERDNHVFPPINSNISSIYAIETKEQSEIENILCDKLETILIEKFISLLRRTAEAARGYDNEFGEDKTLIRHVYDLSLISNAGYDVKLAKSIFKNVIEEDKERFGNRHVEFKSNPENELLYGLEQLTKDKKHKDRYEEYLKPFVYNSNAPSWDEGIKSLKNLAIILIK